MESTVVKLERAIKHVKKAHENDRNMHTALYSAGIEKEDCSDIMLFLADRIEDQYDTSAPSTQTKAFVKTLRMLSAEIEQYVIM